MEAPRCGERDLANLADHAAQTGVAQAFLHGRQHMRIAAGFDVYDSIGMQSRKMEGWCEQVTRAQAPEYRPFATGKDTGKKHRGGGIIGQFASA